jgi:hypothetical protein
MARYRTGAKPRTNHNPDAQIAPTALDPQLVDLIVRLCKEPAYAGDRPRADRPRA